MEMEEDGIGLVLAKATELKLKISNCIEKTTNGSNTPSPRAHEKKSEEEEEGKKVETLPNGEVREAKEEEDEQEEEEEETENLLNIRDALESLESQLAALQDLQQKQRYEKEVALAEIDYSRKMLLEKLKEYKGDHLEVIDEASSFAGEKVEHNSDLLLPPYLSRTPHALVLDNGYMSRFRPTRKSVQNGVMSGDSANKAEKKQMQNNPGTSRRGLGHFISLAAKTVLPLLGVVYVLSLSDSRLQLGKGSTPFKFLSLLQRPPDREKRLAIECPPGKVLVIEDGEARCLVKERIEIPFESAVAKPDVNYGCG